MISLQSTLKEIPNPIRLFLGKALLFFVIWKILYIGFLSDSKLLDYPLTTHVASVSTEVLNRFDSLTGYKSVREVMFISSEGNTGEVSQIYHNDKKIVYVEDGCNGLELLVLYIGFIVCMPSSLWRKIQFIFIGVVFLHSVNILRGVSLIYIREYHEAYFDFAHVYLFKLILYALTFILWMIFARKTKIFHETSKV